ncbi:hypothetical protein H8D30_06720 [bacterium]|nr:hypothetical protein [bacterium]
MTEVLVSIAILMVVMTVLLAVLDATFRTLRIVGGETNAQERARLALAYTTQALDEATSLTDVMHPAMKRRGTRGDYEAELVSNGNCDDAVEVDPTTAPYPNGDWWRQDIDASCFIEPGEVVDPDLTWSNAFSTGSFPTPGGCALQVGGILTEPGQPQSGIPAALADSNQNPDQSQSGVFSQLIGDSDVTLPSWLSDVTCGYQPYMTALEDQNGNGNYARAETDLRTIVFSVNTPVYTAQDGSHVPQSKDDFPGLGDQRDQVETRIVTLAHTWREKGFLIPYSENMSDACDPEAYNHLSGDFVLYQRITRFFNDPWIDRDIDQDGVIDDPALGRDLEDECLRTVETPLVLGVADIRFKLYGGQGHAVLPCTGGCLTSMQGAPLEGTFYWSTDGTPTVPQGFPFTSLGSVRKIEVSVWAASDDVLGVLRRTRDSNGLIFQIFQGDSEALGRLDFMGILAQQGVPDLYNPSNFVQLRETVDMRFGGG